MTLEALCAARLSRPDLPHTMSNSEATAYVAHTVTIERHLTLARAATHTLAALPSVDRYRTWHAHLEEWLATLTPELLAFKKPVRDAKTLGRPTNLRLSIRTIHHGTRVLEDTGYGLTTLRLGELMIASGYEIVGADPLHNYMGTLPWFGSLSDVEKQIADVDARRVTAQAQLDDALMDDDEHERREAEAKQYSDALNALVIKVSGDGTHLVAYKDRRAVRDGEPYRVEDMTVIERRAFERMADRELQCVAHYLPNGIDVRLMEGDDFRRTRLVRDAPATTQLADQWRVALIGRGWNVVGP